MLATMQIQFCGGTLFITYNAVGIDASKGKSTVSIIRPSGVVVKRPYYVMHTTSGLNNLISYIHSLEGETQAVVKCTGRYHEPVPKVFSEANIYIYSQY